MKLQLIIMKCYFIILTATTKTDFSIERPFFKSLFLFHDGIFPMTLLFHVIIYFIVTFHGSGVGTALSNLSATHKPVNSAAAAKCSSC